MDFNRIVARAKALLLSPKTEWPVIAGEAETPKGLYMGYVAPMAALPAVAGFVKSAVIGTSIPFVGGVYRSSMGGALTGAILSFVVALVSVFVVALIIDALAPTFGATKDRMQALKTAGYAYTASFVAGILVIIPGLGLSMLIGLIAAGYGFYLLYLGLPHTMKAPADKAIGYTVVTVIVAIVVSMILGAVTAGIVGSAAYGGFGRGGLTGSAGSISSPDGGSVSGGALGGLSAFAEKAEKASKEMEAAQKSGDANAQAAAAGNMLATVLGGGDKVESLPTDRIKGFLPATLGGLKQVSSSAERNGAMGVQVSEARASYGDGNRSLDLEITDMGGARGLMGLASWVNIEEDKQTQTGYEKTYKQGENMIHEEWDSSAKHGEYSAVLAGRFLVKVSGEAGSVGELKAAIGGVDMTGLAALRNEGLKAAN